MTPKPEPNEMPSSYGDRLGRWYSATAPAEHKKSYGQYLTPNAVATHMARLFGIEQEEIRLLDPGAGSGVLTCAVGEYLVAKKVRPARVYVEAYETVGALARVLKTSLSYLKQWLASYKISLEAAVSTKDFVMAYSEAIGDALGESPGLFESESTAGSFDIVIANPPYFKIPKSDPRAKAASAVIHGQPNIYALFMAASAAALKPRGQLVFITPRSYASGPYFNRFRDRFFSKMKPERIHVFESRVDAFKRDDVLQENIILKASREDGWSERSDRGHIWISASIGSSDFSRTRLKRIPSDLVLDMSSRDKVLHIPATDEELAIMEKVRSWPGSLRSYGLDISTGPVVPFRSVTLLEEAGEVPATHAPLLWMQHVKAMEVQWPIPEKKKPQYIKIMDAALKLLVPNKNYVLIRRFSAKEEPRRLVAAPILHGQLKSVWLGLENHLNYIHRPGGELTDVEAWGLSALYNSSMLDSYFRTMNGNTQVSATELRAMPLPDHETIIRLGRAAMELKEPLQEIDDLVEESLSRRGLNVGARKARAEGVCEVPAGG
jgi:adenine-specific DNA-methyltransferase